jgi:hypothetical protein
MNSGVALAFAIALTLPVYAGTNSDECCKMNLCTGEGVSLGNVIFPELNYQATGGSSSTDPASLAVGHHDPDRHGITQQAIEFSLGMKLSHNVMLFGNYSVKIDQDDHWFDEFEEYYATISDLPGGIRIRGGRFYPRFGLHNEEHHHAIFFVDENLANGRLVGEDHFTLYGGEIAKPLLRSLPARSSDRLTLAFGAIPVDRPEAGEDEFPEPLFDGEGAHFQDWAVAADYALTFDVTASSRWKAGASGVLGHNQADRSTQLYALYGEYIWQPGGVHEGEHCGKGDAEFLRWRGETIIRRAGLSSDSMRKSITEIGLNTSLSYGLPDGKWMTHLRAEYLSGTAETGTSERWRISPAVTWIPSAEIPARIGLQYNYDHSPAFGDEHSIWAQISITWGDCCAHPH